MDREAARVYRQWPLLDRALAKDIVYGAIERAASSKGHLSVDESMFDVDYERERISVYLNPSASELFLRDDRNRELQTQLNDILGEMQEAHESCDKTTGEGVLCASQWRPADGYASEGKGAPGPGCNNYCAVEGCRELVRGWIDQLPRTFTAKWRDGEATLRVTSGLIEVRRAAFYKSDNGYALFLARFTGPPPQHNDTSKRWTVVLPDGGETTLRASEVADRLCAFVHEVGKNMQLKVCIELNASSRGVSITLPNFYALDPHSPASYAFKPWTVARSGNGWNIFACAQLPSSKQHRVSRR